jgi:Fe2+ or Zn2+ uptake regulation protein
MSTGLRQRRDVSLATVYRVLTQFELSGILVRHTEGGIVFELNRRPP